MIKAFKIWYHRRKAWQLTMHAAHLSDPYDCGMALMEFLDSGRYRSVITARNAHLNRLNDLDPQRFDRRWPVSGPRIEEPVPLVAEPA